MAPPAITSPRPSRPMTMVLLHSRRIAQGKREALMRHGYLLASEMTSAYSARARRECRDEFVLP